MRTKKINNNMIYSAGIILYKKTKRTTSFLMATPAGPYWTHRTLWSFPKGEVENNEHPIITAIREFKEETDYDVSAKFTKLKYLGLVRQSKNKSVFVFSLKADPEEYYRKFNCNSMVTMEYPKDSGEIKTFPEIKDIQWIKYEDLMERPRLHAYDSIYNKIAAEEP